MSALRVVIVAWCTYFVFYLARLNMAALIPVIGKDTGTSYALLGFIASGMYAAYMLMQLPSGIIADRYGVDRILRLGSGCIALGNSLFASFSAPLGMAFGQLLNGMGQSAGWPSLTQFVIKNVGEGRRSTMISLMGTSVPLGVTAAFLFSERIARLSNWRFAFFAPAALVLGWMVFFALITQGVPKDFDREISLKSVLKLIKCRNVWLLSVIQLSVLFCMFGLFTWMTTFLVEEFALTPLGAARYGAIIPLAGVLGAPLGGVIFDMIRNGKFVIILNQVALALLFFTLARADSLTLALILTGLASFFLRFSIGPVYTLGSETVREELAGSVTGFIVFVGNIGTVIATFTVGLIIDLTPSFAYVFSLFGAISLISVPLGFFIRPPKPE